MSNDYPLLSEAVGAGLFHPNCKHATSVYIEGLTKVPKPDQDARRYEVTQRQRANERNIRKWKKREVVALTPEEKQKARAKVSGWQKANRELVKKHDIPRKYQREQINKAR